MATIARDEANTRVSDRLKALELIARIHGMLQDKLDVDIALPQLKRAMGGLIAQAIGAGAQRTLPVGGGEAPVDAELAPTKGDPGASKQPKG